MTDKESYEFAKENVRINMERGKESRRIKEQEKINKLALNSGVKKRFRKRTFETFISNTTNEKALETALDFTENFDTREKGLLFSGSVGTGKTHIAAAIANDLMDKMHTVIFGNITTIISRIKSTYRSDSELTEADILDKLTNVDLLIIDDLGKEYTSENTNTLLYQIINALYEDEKLIVVTTNLSAEKLKNKIGQATVSRLIEMTDKVKMGGEDWRLK